MVINKGVAIYYAGTDLCSKLSLVTCLASYYGSDMRLEDTDDTVSTLMDFRLEHLLLLMIHLENRYKQLPVMWIERLKYFCSVAADDVKTGTDIAIQHCQQIFKALMYLLLRLRTQRTTLSLLS